MICSYIFCFKSQKKKSYVLYTKKERKKATKTTQQQTTKIIKLTQLRKAKKESVNLIKNKQIKKTK